MARLSFAPLAPKGYGGLLAVTVVFFAFGFAAGAIVKPGELQHTLSVDTARVPSRDSSSARFAAGANAGRLNAQLDYPAEVIRVIDGDTFEARVHVWPGLDVSTKVRLRNVDAPELHAHCVEELAKAQAARAALETLLSAGGVTVARVGTDKYGGRVDAVVATHDTADVSTALLKGGWARSYDGGRRGSWC
ncbi:MAG: thermonuclease family protein [Xanthobacteraceae bacterium]